MEIISRNLFHLHQNDEKENIRCGYLWIFFQRNLLHLRWALLFFPPLPIQLWNFEYSIIHSLKWKREHNTMGDMVFRHGTLLFFDFQHALVVCCCFCCCYGFGVTWLFSSTWLVGCYCCLVVAIVLLPSLCTLNLLVFGHFQGMSVFIWIKKLVYHGMMSEKNVAA